MIVVLLASTNDCIIWEEVVVVAEILLLLTFFAYQHGLLVDISLSACPPISSCNPVTPNALKIIMNVLYCLNGCSLLSLEELSGIVLKESICIVKILYPMVGLHVNYVIICVPHFM